MAVNICAMKACLPERQKAIKFWIDSGAARVAYVLATLYGTRLTRRVHATAWCQAPADFGFGPDPSVSSQETLPRL